MACFMCQHNKSSLFCTPKYINRDTSKSFSVVTPRGIKSGHALLEKLITKCQNKIQNEMGPECLDHF